MDGVDYYLVSLGFGSCLDSLVLDSLVLDSLVCIHLDGQR